MKAIGYTIHISNQGKTVSFERLYTYKEVATILDVHPITVFRLVKSKKLRTSAPRGRPYIPGIEIARLIESYDPSNSARKEEVAHGTR